MPSRLFNLLNLVAIYFCYLDMCFCNLLCYYDFAQSKCPRVVFQKWYCPSTCSLTENHFWVPGKSHKAAIVAIRFEQNCILCICMLHKNWLVVQILWNTWMMIKPSVIFFLNSSLLCTKNTNHSVFFNQLNMNASKFFLTCLVTLATEQSKRKVFEY